MKSAKSMQIAKWGNSAAVRLPKETMEKNGWKIGDDLKFVSNGHACVITRDLTVEQALKALRKYRGWMPEDFKFNREEAHERGYRLDEAQGRRASRRAS